MHERKAVSPFRVSTLTELFRRNELRPNMGLVSKNGEKVSVKRWWK